ncbi:hypothetical protein D8682_11845 [Buttiauxella sp. 3AFRM03]|nr:hypothetical protein D8682_11845 [Buttiauxella sp. 3AFRM03]
MLQPFFHQTTVNSVFLGDVVFVRYLDKFLVFRFPAVGVDACGGVPPGFVLPRCDPAMLVLFAFQNVILRFHRATEGGTEDAVAVALWDVLAYHLNALYRRLWCAHTVREAQYSFEG